MRNIYICAVAALALQACSSSSTTDGNENTEEGSSLTGRFIDVSPVEGLAYRTDSSVGFTNADGQFQYLLGEQIIFSVGDVELPATAAQAIVTGLDIFSTPDTLNPAVVNLNRLLFTLDTDGQIDNGVQVPELAAFAATGLQLDFMSREFEAEVINLVANSGAQMTSLVNTGLAVTAFINSLDQESVAVSDCTSSHSLVGTTATFDTFFHEVSGTVRVLDDCTLEITNFTYDGLGPSVYFYAGQNRVYEGRDVFFFPFLLTGTVFDNARLRLRIPEGKTLDDFNSLSVWCFDVRVNFGDAFLEI